MASLALQQLFPKQTLLIFLRFELLPNFIFQCYRLQTWQFYLFFPALSISSIHKVPSITFKWGYRSHDPLLQKAYSVVEIFHRFTCTNKMKPKILVILVHWKNWTSSTVWKFYFQNICRVFLEYFHSNTSILWNWTKLCKLDFTTFFYNISQKIFAYKWPNFSVGWEVELCFSLNVCSSHIRSFCLVHM